MKKIVCELCEGTEFAKENGAFVCKGCGTSYTAEEAKALMKEVEGDAAPVVGGAPSVNPNQQQIDNLLVLATNAFESSNNEETEGYCNRIIELDVTCYRAWLLKGQAIAWQSQYGNPRVDEGANAMRKAVDFAPEEEKENIARQALNAIRNVCNALANLTNQNFGNSPTEANRLKFGEFARICSNTTASFNDVSDEIAKYSSEVFTDHKKFAASQMNLAGVSAVQMAREKWKEIDYPNKNSLDTYIEWYSEISMLFGDSISWGEAVGEEDSELITRYENRIIAIEDPMEACSYKQEWSDWQSKYIWVKDFSLTDEAKSSRRKQVSELKSAISKIKNKAKEAEKAAKRAAEEAKQQRIKAYWEAHKDEKAKLDAEKKELSDKKSKLDSEIANIDKEIKAIEADEKGKVPAEVEADKLKEQKRELENRRSKLGLFAGKEKKQIGEEIAAIEGRISALDDKAKEEKKAKSDEIKKKVAPLKNKKDELNKELPAITRRISAIDAELSKDPEE